MLSLRQAWDVGVLYAFMHYGRDGNLRLGTVLALHQNLGIALTVTMPFEVSVEQASIQSCVCPPPYLRCRCVCLRSGRCPSCW